MKEEIKNANTVTRLLTLPTNLGCLKLDESKTKKANEKLEITESQMQTIKNGQRKVGCITHY